MEDTQIVALYCARSEEAITETSQKYGRYLETIARNILPNPEDTEEILNDLYLTAWNTIPPKCPTVLKYYLSRVVRNLCFKRIEYLAAGKRNGNGDMLLSELEACIPDSGADLERTWEVRELSRLINRFLATLSRDDRKLFLSRYYYAVPVPELAERNGCSVRRIKYRLEKLREKLKIALQKEGMWL